jgi:hypothetical protein
MRSLILSLTLALALCSCASNAPHFSLISNPTSAPEKQEMMRAYAKWYMDQLRFGAPKKPTLPVRMNSI